MDPPLSYQIIFDTSYDLIYTWVMNDSSEPSEKSPNDQPQPFFDFVENSDKVKSSMGIQNEHRRKRKQYCKLTKAAQDHVIQRLASGFSNSMIAAEIYEKFQIAVHKTTINRYRRGQWQKRVQALRKVMDEKLAEHPLASKVARLNWLLEAAEEARTFRTDKVIFQKEGEKIVVKKCKVGEIKGLMREARIELEGDKEPPVVGVKIVIERPDEPEKSG